jgi:hypothetical protein
MKRQVMWLVLLAAGAALAQSQQRGPPRGGPPPEALAACSGQSEGARCSFSIQERSLNGTCRNGPRGETAACVPDGMRPGGHRGPPGDDARK